MDTDAARQIALVIVEFCFNYDFNAELIQRIDWMGGYDVLKAIVICAAMSSWRVGVAESRSSWCRSRAGAGAGDVVVVVGCQQEVVGRCSFLVVFRCKS